MDTPYLAAVATATTAGHHGNGVRQKGHLASALDGVGDVVLVLRAGASDATGLDLATVGHVLAKELSILVVDELSVLLAELAVLATRLTLVLSSHVSKPFCWRAAGLRPDAGSLGDVTRDAGTPATWCWDVARPGWPRTGCPRRTHPQREVQRRGRWPARAAEPAGPGREPAELGGHSHPAAGNHRRCRPDESS